MGMLIAPSRFTTGGGGGGSDPDFGSVVSLLHFDGTDGSTTFTDVIGKTWTPNGDTQIDTAQSKYGGASGLFDGAGDYLQSAATTDFDMFGGNFTLEMWMRFPSRTITSVLWDFQLSSSSYALFQLQSSGSMQFFTSVSGLGGSQILTTTPAVDTWHHLALTKSGSTFTLWVNGTSAGTSTTSDYPSGSAITCYLSKFGTVADQNFNGWIDDFRVTKGVCRYTASFTPSGPWPDS